jgi:hypothetical protein
VGGVHETQAVMKSLQVVKQRLPQKRWKCNPILFPSLFPFSSLRELHEPTKIERCHVICFLYQIWLLFCWLLFVLFFILFWLISFSISSFTHLVLFYFYVKFGFYAFDYYLFCLLSFFIFFLNFIPRYFIDCGFGFVIFMDLPSMKLIIVSWLGSLVSKISSSWLKNFLGFFFQFHPKH